MKRREAARSVQSVVLEDADLVGCILAHAELSPEDLVAVCQVGKAWRAAVHGDAALLIAAACRPQFLTKRSFCGLFALNSREADDFPHRVTPCRKHGSVMCMYTAPAVRAAVPAVGGMEGWRRRLARRVATEMSGAGLCSHC